MFCGTILVKARAIRVFDFQGTILAVNTQNTWAMFMCVLPTFPNRLFARAVIVLHERPIFTRDNPVRSTPPDIADRYGLYHRVLLGCKTICRLVRDLSSSPYSASAAIYRWGTSLWGAGMENALSAAAKR